MAPPETATLGGLRHDVVASRDGVVEAVDCLRLARIARLAEVMASLESASEEPWLAHHEEVEP